MRVSTNARILMTASATLAAATGASGADFVAWFSKEKFVAATGASLRVTFEEPEWDIAVGVTYFGSIASGGIDFVPVASLPIQPNLSVAPATQTNFCCPLSSQTLTASGNEDIDLRFDRPLGAVGFTCFANNGAPILFTVETVSGILFEISNVNPPNQIGFAGFSSSEPIVRVNWTATLGEVINTGIDDVLVGAPLCPADLDGDGLVGPADLAILLGAWEGSGLGDLDGSGSIGAADLAILLGAWGPCGGA